MAASLALCSGLIVRFVLFFKGLAAGSALTTAGAGAVPLTFAQRALAAAAILALAAALIFLRPFFTGASTATLGIASPPMILASFCSSAAISSLIEMTLLKLFD